MRREAIATLSAPASTLRARAGPLAALLAAMLSVQLGATFAKKLFSLVGPEGVAGLRVGLGALLLAALLRPWRAKVARRDLPALFGYGVSLGLMNIVFYLALARIPLGLAVALEFTGPLALAVLASRRRLDLAWVALAGVGLLLIAPWTGGLARLDPLGGFLALLAGGFWALYIHFGAKTGAALKSQAVALGSLIAAAFVAPLAAAAAGPRLLQPAALGAGALVAVLSSAAPYSLEMIALRRLPPRVFGVLMSVEPGIAALMGLVLLGEVLPPREIIALVLITAAAFGAASFSEDDAGAAPPPRDPG